jgi:IrrE N-terminal-like domain
MIQRTENATERTLRRVLLRDAADLGAGRTLPLDVPELIGELGLSLAFEAPVGRRAAHGMLRRRESGWQIVINAATAPTRQRYTMAHELGHYLIEARTGYRPETSRAYWMVEEVCQAFAASLLSPSRVVSAAIGAEPFDADRVVPAIDRVMVRTGLSLEAAARRIAETAADPLAIVALDVGGRKPISAMLAWAHANIALASIARGQKVRRRHWLWPAAARALEIAVGARSAVDLVGMAQATVERRGESFVLVTASPTGGGSRP